MSLLREIQDAAVDQSTDLPALLRKCKILAARLGNNEFKSWVDYELNGYKDVADVPDYRILYPQSYGDFDGPFGSGRKNAPIPLSSIPESFRKNLSMSYLMQPISAYVALLGSKSSGTFQERWNADLVALVGGNIYQGMACIVAWKSIPYGSIASLVDTIKTRVLNFCLEIESAAPDAGEALLNHPPLPQERVSQVFNTYISGNVQNVATGSSDFVQTATMNGPSDEIFRNLINALTAAIASEAEKKIMVQAAESLRDSHGTPGFLQKYREFMGTLADHMQVFGPICSPFLSSLAGMLS